MPSARWSIDDVCPEVSLDSGVPKSTSATASREILHQGGHDGFAREHRRRQLCGGHPPTSAPLNKCAHTGGLGHLSPLDPGTSRSMSRAVVHSHSRCTIACRGKSGESHVRRRSAHSKDAVLDAARQSTALSNKEARGHPAVALASGFKSWRGTEILVIPVGSRYLTERHRPGEVEHLDDQCSAHRTGGRER